MHVSVICEWLRNYRFERRRRSEGECEKGGWEGVARSCDIAAAARLRISVFSLRERGGGEREGARRGEIGSVCGVLLCQISSKRSL